MKFNHAQFINSITGVSTAAGVLLLMYKRYDLAALAFTLLSAGAAGVLWERYTSRSGHPLSLKALTTKRLPERNGEIDFALTHLPYPTLAAISFFLAKRKARSNHDLQAL
ncbi:MAG: hypothetical protein WD231_05725 [Candidatus Woykebacteria bacterium]